MDFIVYIAYLLLEQKTLESHKKVCKNKDFCGVAMPHEENEILELNQ